MVREREEMQSEVRFGRHGRRGRRKGAGAKNREDRERRGEGREWN
jgi:hypothetical protein